MHNDSQHLKTKSGELRTKDWCFQPERLNNDCNKSIPKRNGKKHKDITRSYGVCYSSVRLGNREQLRADNGCVVPTVGLVMIEFREYRITTI